MASRIVTAHQKHTESIQQALTTHGPAIVSGVRFVTGAADPDITRRFPVGMRLRILPNHACATGAQHPAYQAMLPGGQVQTWPRFYGW
jgi:D-serine deaminase-like pyridoxal phosphate-dependent protein